MDTLIDDGLSVKIIRTKRRKTASIIIADGLVKAVVPEESGSSEKPFLVVTWFLF